MAGPLTIQQTLELARRTRHIVDETRSLIASARRLLNPGWGISGGSEEDSDHAGALFRSIRSLLERGVLIPAPDNVWAGHGTGKPCFICTQKIDADEIANETSLDAEVKVWAHLACFNIWWWASRVFEAEHLSSTT